MRVLMLGWEFPPHISGGLGTACYGMTKGLDEIGVDVCFVLPTAIPVDAAVRNSWSGSGVVTANSTPSSGMRTVHAMGYRAPLARDVKIRPVGVREKLAAER